MSAWLQLLLVLAGVALPGQGSRAAGPQERFPHEVHERLFPVCEGCHAGAVENGASVYPDAAVCARCHDGTRVQRVSWTTPAHRATNLLFSHTMHARVSTLGGRPAQCANCHQSQGGGRMSVAAPKPQACFACHDNGEHLEGGDGCRQCHAALTEVTEWDASRIAALPRPAKHAAPDFLHTHGQAARAGSQSCAICHARESCERCHPNGQRLAAITALASDARVASLTRGRAARYEAPASHASGWEWTHGRSADRSTETCANCHTRTNCTSCHARDNQAIRSLPDARAGGAGGVKYGSKPRVHAAGFERSHQARGASDASCMNCHERKSCDACHAAQRSNGFHEPNFLEQHGPAAFASDVQCTSCHSTERFCRGCHQGTGRAAASRSNVVFHSTTPLWLLGHGQAARQSLESCASCHAQNDCTRCHSALGGWGVNPHGNGFNAARLEQQSRLTCLRCHRASELGRQ